MSKRTVENVVGYGVVVALAFIAPLVVVRLTMKAAPPPKPEAKAQDVAAHDVKGEGAIPDQPQGKRDWWHEFAFQKKADLPAGVISLPAQLHSWHGDGHPYGGVHKTYVVTARLYPDRGLTKADKPFREVTFGPFKPNPGVKEVRPVDIYWSDVDPGSYKIRLAVSSETSRTGVGKDGKVVTAEPDEYRAQTVWVTVK